MEEVPELLRMNTAEELNLSTWAQYLPERRDADALRALEAANPTRWKGLLTGYLCFCACEVSRWLFRDAVAENLAVM